MKLAIENADNFLYLMERYEDKLMRYIKRLTNVSEGDAEDLLQEIFIKTYENLNDFDQSLKFSSWIYRIAHNHVVSFARKKKEVYLSDDESAFVFDNLVDNTDLQESLDQKMRAEKVQAILNHLDEKYRDVIILKFLEDKNYTEISNILKKPMGTVAVLLNRGKEKFREILLKNNIT